MKVIFYKKGLRNIYGINEFFSVSLSSMSSSFHKRCLFLCRMFFTVQSLLTIILTNNYRAKPQV